LAPAPSRVERDRPAAAGLALAPAEPADGEGYQQDDEADLQDQAEERGDPAEAAEEAAAQERAEQAGTEQAGHEAAAEASAGLCGRVHAGIAHGRAGLGLRALDRGRGAGRRGGGRGRRVGARAARTHATAAAATGTRLDDGRGENQRRGEREDGRRALPASGGGEHENASGEQLGSPALTPLLIW
jgi:hypothetical protein